MTVAAVVLFAQPEAALADAAGRVAVRRIVESAWAGGATPIVVVSADPSGQLAQALAGSPAVLAEPAPVEVGPVGQIVRGIEVAASNVTETDAAIIWPGRMAWVDAETITTLIEAHGPRRDAILRPRYGDELGWPALVPLGALPQLRAQDVALMPGDVIAGAVAAGVALDEIDTGDPGVMHDISTSLDALPPYQGPAEPGAGPPPEWGAAAADMPDDTPLAGPTLAPYGPADRDAAPAGVEESAPRDEKAAPPAEEPAPPEEEPTPPAEAAEPLAEESPRPDAEPTPPTEAISRGLEILRQAHSVLLVDWPSWEVPDALVRAGLQVTSREREDEYFSYAMEGGQILRHGPVDAPSQVDIVYAHRPLAELEGIVVVALRVGAAAVWLQSGIDRPYESDDSRRIVEAAGLEYLGDDYIAAIARQVEPSATETPPAAPE